MYVYEYDANCELRRFRIMLLLSLVIVKYVSSLQLMEILELLFFNSYLFRVAFCFRTQNNVCKVICVRYFIYVQINDLIKLCQVLK